MCYIVRYNYILKPFLPPNRCIAVLKVEKYYIYFPLSPY